MALDLLNDYQVLDETEAVTLAGVAVTGAYRLPDRTLEGEPTDAAYLHREVEWHLPDLPAVVAGAAVGNVLVAGAVSFVVLEVRQPFANDYFGLRTRAMSVADELITLWPVVVVTDEYGSRKATHPAPDGMFSDIPAKIQPLAGVEDVIAGKRQFRRMFDIYVATEVTALSIGDLLQDSAMNWYDVVSWRNRERIDELSVILCEYHD